MAPDAFVPLYVSLGDLDRAFEQAQRGCELREGFRWATAFAPWAEALSAHPRHRELLPRGWKGR